MFAPGEIQSRGMISEAADVASRSIVGVDIRPALYTGSAICLILLFLLLPIVYNYDPVGGSTLDDMGCFVNKQGQPITEPIYKNDSNGKRVVIGVNNCVRPTPKFIIYIFAIIGSAVLGLLAGTAVYRIMFAIANPKLSAGIAATGMFRSALTGK